MERRFGNVVAVKEVSSQFQKEGTKSVLLQQDVSTTYPASRNNTDGIIADSELGAGETFVNKRNAIVVIPSSMTVEQFNERLQKFPKAGLRKIISSEPIVNENHKWAMKERGLTIETIAERQIVKEVNKETGEEVVINHKKTGEPCYRVVELVSDITQKGDVDLVSNNTTETVF